MFDNVFTVLKRTADDIDWKSSYRCWQQALI